MTAPAREFTAEEAGAAGVADEFVGLDLAGKPGSALFTGQGEDEVVKARYTVTSTDPTEYQIYDRDGRPWRMPRLVALTRLKKRYPATDHRYPNMPVFLPTQIKVPPEATIDCPAMAELGCRKKFTTALMADQHLRSRHRGTWSLREEQRQRDLQERQANAAEMQTAAMTRMLERMGPAAEADSMGEGPLPFEPDDTIETGNGFDVETADKKALMRYASESGIAKAAGKNPMLVPIEELREMCRAALAIETESA